tara:strand:+ start:98 stop:1117 length:1020 start_codon:yes stop_codon:yes gene_type:complete
LKRKIFVTGAAGFIGFHICERLLNNGDKVIGFDNLNSYYDQNLKKARLKILESTGKNWNFIKGDLEDVAHLNSIFLEFKPEIVIHLAAQAGVRYSIKNPSAYISSNLLGFSNILENCRKNKISNLIYASSSSVYGGNRKIPFIESDPTNHPVSLYAATKRANELMAHSYSHLYNIPCTGLRFFTVYGPWGRPDMAPMIFTKAILDNNEIKIFNNGDLQRDFTYIEDVTEIIFRLVNKPATANLNFFSENPDPSSSWCKHKIFNIGNNKKIQLLDFINKLEEILEIKAKKKFMPMQTGDVQTTFSNSDKIEKWIGFKPSTDISEGINKFTIWYKNFYKYI